MRSLPLRRALCLVAFSFLVAKADPVWPAPKDELATVASHPDKTVSEALLKESDAAFDKKAFPDAVALRDLARLTHFMAAHPLPDGLRAWMVENRTPSEEFIRLFSRYEDPRAVASILSKIWNADEKGFRVLPRLAFAIALVYDRPCPQWFPHSQVKPDALPRKLNDPVDVFSFYRAAWDSHRLVQPPDRLAIDELAFVVSFVTPLSEMREVQKRRIVRGDVAKLYASIVYDIGRFHSGQYVWPGSSYSLDTIKKRGGICVDQAYYSSTIAQAFGIPAFILSGSGADGYHAFVGYLERPGKWKLDVGRYENQKFATGTAFNPLTWGELTDHDLAFLQERFQNTPAYPVVLLHVEKAREALKKKDFETASRLLDTARSTEPRCPDVWSASAELADARGDDLAKQEKLFRAAAETCARYRYRELEVEWSYRVAEVLAKQGKEEAADQERVTIVGRSARVRPEVAVVLARQLMAKAVTDADVKKGLLLFGRLAGQFEDAGILFFTKIGYPYVQTLLAGGKKKEAQQVASILGQRFKAQKGSQLEQMRDELTRWASNGTAGESLFKGQAEQGFSDK